MLAITGQNFFTLSCVHVPAIGAPREAALDRIPHLDRIRCVRAGRHRDDERPALRSRVLRPRHEPLSRRVKDPPIAEPERDMVGALGRAVGDRDRRGALARSDRLRRQPPAATSRAERAGPSRGRRCGRGRSSRCRRRSGRPTRTAQPRKLARRRDRVGRGRRGQLALALLDHVARAPTRGSRTRSPPAPSRPGPRRPSSGSPRSACVTCSASSRGSARTGATATAHLTRRSRAATGASPSPRASRPR